MSFGRRVYVAVSTISYPNVLEIMFCPIVDAVVGRARLLTLTIACPENWPTGATLIARHLYPGYLVYSSMSVDSCRSIFCSHIPRASNPAYSVKFSIDVVIDLVLASLITRIDFTSSPLTYSILIGT